MDALALIAVYLFFSILLIAFVGGVLSLIVWMSEDHDLPEDEEFKEKLK